MTFFFPSDLVSRDRSFPVVIRFPSQAQNLTWVSANVADSLSHKAYDKSSSSTIEYATMITILEG